MAGQVAVIGAGAVGLSTAVNIQRKIPGVRVTIYTDREIRDTTSTGAGGVFVPTLNQHPPDKFWDKTTLNQIIEMFVLYGSELDSDSWPGYADFNWLPYDHFSSCHVDTFSQAFQHIVTKAVFCINSNMMEGFWKILRGFFRNMNGTSAHMIESHIMVVQWMRMCTTDDTDPLNQLAEDIKLVYDHKGPGRITYPTKSPIYSTFWNPFPYDVYRLDRVEFTPNPDGSPPTSDHGTSSGTSNETSAPAAEAAESSPNNDQNTNQPSTSGTVSNHDVMKEVLTGLSVEYEELPGDLEECGRVPDRADFEKGNSAGYNVRTTVPTTTTRTSSPVNNSSTEDTSSPSLCLSEKGDVSQNKERHVTGESKEISKPASDCKGNNPASRRRVLHFAEYKRREEEQKKSATAKPVSSNVADPSVTELLRSLQMDLNKGKPQVPRRAEKDSFTVERTYVKKSLKPRISHAVVSESGGSTSDVHRYTSGTSENQSSIVKSLPTSSRDSGACVTYSTLGTTLKPMLEKKVEKKGISITPHTGTVVLIKKSPPKDVMEAREVKSNLLDVPAAATSTKCGKSVVQCCSTRISQQKSHDDIITISDDDDEDVSVIRPSQISHFMKTKIKEEKIEADSVIDLTESPDMSPARRIPGSYRDRFKGRKNIKKEQDDHDTDKYKDNHNVKTEDKYCGFQKSRQEEYISKGKRPPLSPSKQVNNNTEYAFKKKLIIKREMFYDKENLDADPETMDENVVEEDRFIDDENVEAIPTKRKCRAVILDSDTDESLPDLPKSDDEVVWKTSTATRHTGAESLPGPSTSSTSGLLEESDTDLASVETIMKKNIDSQGKQSSTSSYSSMRSSIKITKIVRNSKGEHVFSNEEIVTTPPSKSFIEYLQYSERNCNKDYTYAKMTIVGKKVKKQDTKNDESGSESEDTDKKEKKISRKRQVEFHDNYSSLYCGGRAKRAKDKRSRETNRKYQADEDKYYAICAKLHTAKTTRYNEDGSVVKKRGRPKQALTAKEKKFLDEYEATMSTKPYREGEKLYKDGAVYSVIGPDGKEIRVNPEDYAEYAIPHLQPGLAKIAEERRKKKKSSARPESAARRSDQDERLERSENVLQDRDIFSSGSQDSNPLKYSANTNPTRDQKKAVLDKVLIDLKKRFNVLVEGLSVPTAGSSDVGSGKQRRAKSAALKSLQEYTIIPERHAENIHELVSTILTMGVPVRVLLTEDFQVEQLMED